MFDLWHLTIERMYYILILLSTDINNADKYTLQSIPGLPME